MIKKWIKRNISLLFGKNKWNIYLSSIGQYQLVQITDPPFRLADLSSIFLKLLGFLLKECEVVLLSQYVDENQGMFVYREQALPELTNRYGLQVRITNDYSSLDQTPSKAKEYVLNVFGKPGIDWLSKVLAYGGTDLSNILYGFSQSEYKWQEAMVNMNRIFNKWYWLETSDIELIHLRDKVTILCWTSDSHLNILLEERALNDVLSYIQEIAIQNTLELNVESKR